MHADGAGTGLALAGNRYGASPLRRVLHLGDVGGSVDIGATLSAKGVQLDDRFVSELQGYADRGGGLPADVVAKGEELYNKAKDYAAKVEAVGEDASVGAAVGALVPILGEIGVGEVIGSVVGAIYGVFDNFSGEIHDLFNPPDFSPDDYHRMQLAGLASGGIPVWGVPPDLYGAIIYPDGALSGGDFPYPGTWNHEIRDQAAYDRAQARDAAAANAPTLCNGVPCKPKPPLAVLHRATTLATIRAINKKDAAERAELLAIVKANRGKLPTLQKPTLAPISSKALSLILATSAPGKTTTDAVKAAPPPAPNAHAPVIIGASVGLAALGLGATWWLTQRKR
jgi:hypothetical protein